jgi:hypothetical protein
MFVVKNGITPAVLTGEGEEMLMNPANREGSSPPQQVEIQGAQVYSSVKSGSACISHPT